LPQRPQDQTQKQMVMSMTTEQLKDKAVQRGRADYYAGKVNNPWLHIGGKFKSMAAWWDAGFIEARQKDRLKHDISPDHQRAV